MDVMSNTYLSIDCLWATVSSHFQLVNFSDQLFTCENQLFTCENTLNELGILNELTSVEIPVFSYLFIALHEVLTIPLFLLTAIQK